MASESADASPLADAFESADASELADAFESADASELADAFESADASEVSAALRAGAALATPFEASDSLPAKPPTRASLHTRELERRQSRSICLRALE